MPPASGYRFQNNSFNIQHYPTEQQMTLLHMGALFGKLRQQATQSWFFPTAFSKAFWNKRSRPPFITYHRVHAFLNMDVQMPFTGWSYIWKYYWERLCQYSCHYISALADLCLLMGRLCTHVICFRSLSLYFIFFFSGVVMSCCLRDLKRISL